MFFMFLFVFVLVLVGVSNVSLEQPGGLSA